MQGKTSGAETDVHAGAIDAGSGEDGGKRRSQDQADRLFSIQVPNDPEPDEDECTGDADCRHDPSECLEDPLDPLGVVDPL